MRFSKRDVVGVLVFLAIAGCSGATNSLPGIAPVSRQQIARSSDEPSGSFETPGHRGCDIRAVFVRFDTEIRGYPLNSSGAVLPCTRISGPHTQLVERGALAISVHGNLHSLSFQSDYGLTIHPRYAENDAAPNRVVSVSQDHIALAVDSLINDYVVASEGYEGDNCWFVVADKQVRTDVENCDPNLGGIHALTTDSRDELIAIGVDPATGGSRIDIFSGAASAAPRLVRTIAGPNTGLPVLTGAQGYFDVSYSLATDPHSGDLYVYSHVGNILNFAFERLAPAVVAQFSADANGDVAPLRVLSGPDVHLARDAFSVNVLSVDDRGNLYVLAAGTTPVVSVFGPSARGDAIPDRTFTDPTATIGFSGAALAVRSVVR